MYIDAYHNRKNDEIWVSERIDGKRITHVESVNYTFYYEDNNGTYKSIFGDNVKKFTSQSNNEYNKKKNQFKNKKTFESDINPVTRFLEENYLNCETPTLNIGFFDIETDFDTQKGFSSADDAFCEITAITTYLSQLKKNITIAVPPNTISFEEAKEIASNFENTFMFKTEKEMLNFWLDIIEDTDVFSGWNSTAYDIPYIVNRIKKVLGKSKTSRLCLWGLYPKERKYEKFKKEHTTYDLFGRIHLDYLELFQKHSLQRYHSYKLDSIGEMVVGEKKVPYDGTLDDLYKNDFYKFIEYSRQDVELLVKIDEKKKYIDLSNQLAHTNTILIPATLGSVALIEQSIINEAHRRNMVVPDKNIDMKKEHIPVAGAHVADPKIGLHEWIGSVDINSLYPSVIRSLNMGPETIIGQIRLDYTSEIIKEKLKTVTNPPDAWHNIFSTFEYSYVLNREDKKLIIDFEDGSTIDIKASDLYDYIFSENSDICLSANGTLFKTNVDAIIPKLLEKWYYERLQMKQKVKNSVKIQKGIQINENLAEKLNSFCLEKLSNKEDFCLEKLNKLIENKDVSELKEYMNKHDLVCENNKIVPKDVEKYKEIETFWDQRQYARKILLNSLYGSLLSKFCRFYDERLGQSVTLTGRSITKHMISETNNILTGNYHYEDGPIIAGDTDSVYFSAYEIKDQNEIFKNFEWTKDNVVKLYDAISEEVNKSFTDFMMNAFNVSKDKAEIIQAAREICGTSALFTKKKRYAIMVYDDEGKRKDINDSPGEIKAMGIETKRSDTPKEIQKFLEKLLTKVLTKGDEDSIINFIREYREKFKEIPPWEKGSPKGINGLTEYLEKYNNSTQKVNLPGHVRASINWNKLKEINNDKHSMEIFDGNKIIICKLKPNPMNMNSIAYPIDETHLPEWFKELPFDDHEMEKTLIDQKVNNLIKCLNFDLDKTKTDTTLYELFE